MEPRADHFASDIRDTNQFGTFISEPTVHFCRIFAHFAPDERRRMLQETHEFLNGTTAEDEATFKKFVADTLRAAHELHALPNDEGNDEDEDESAASAELISATAAGESARGLATILANTVFVDRIFGGINEDLLDFFGRTLGQRVLTPEQAAAVASCVAYNLEACRRFELHASDIIAESKVLPEGFLRTVSEVEYHYERKYGYIPKSGGKYVEDLLKDLETTLGSYQLRREDIFESQRGIVRPDNLFGTFGLEGTGTGLFVPVRRGIVVAENMKEAFRLAERDKSNIMAMSPRRFEEFMAALFSSLGFEVQLTQTTRDGGADLLCLRCHHGLPFRLAVEVKRYKDDRPITVQLVRSFVGANVKFRANQLVYITTSRYTQPAQEYAALCNPCFLTLKQYDQIREWCASVRSETPSLL